MRSASPLFTVPMPVMYPASMFELNSGAGWIWPLSSASTSDTESTTAPTTRPRTLSTMTTVKPLYSTHSQPSFSRRSMIGTITPRPQSGNPQPRLFRLIDREAIINRMGFNNPGITRGVENVRAASTFRGILGFNIGKNKDTPNENAADDYLACLREAYPVADYIAVN